jgi:GDSL-like Lipase/Acylhydrolase family
MLFRSRALSSRCWCRVATIAILLLSLSCGIYIGLPLPAASADDSAATPLQIVQALAAMPAVVTAASFESVPPQGTPNAAMTTSLASFPTAGDSYALLTTGDASLAAQPNTSSGSGANDAGSNVRGNTDFDVTVLKAQLNVPVGVNCLLGMDFRFLSEEYPEFVGSAYNDAFIAEIDKSTWTTSGSTITAPDNFAFDPKGNPITINAAGTTSMSADEAAGTTYDGATPLLTAATPVSPGQHSLFLSIFDQGDRILDSAVMLDNLRFGAVSNVSTDCVPGAKPVDATPRYVALGDSYSAGEGVPAFQPWTDQSPKKYPNLSDRNMCHRSYGAYSALLSEKDGMPKNEHWACSGAEIPNLYHGQWNEGPQLDKIAPKGQHDDSVKLVTLTMGGNDVGFAYVLGNCYHPGPGTVRKCRSYDALVRQSINSLGTGRPELCFPGVPCIAAVPSLHQVYKDIIARAPNAHVIVLGYPHLFPKSPAASCEVGSVFLSVPRPVTTLKIKYTRDDMIWMNQMGDLLNQKIAAEVDVVDPTGLKVTFVPVADAFAGHEVCAGDPSTRWIRAAEIDYWQFNSLSSSLFAYGADIRPWSFHPNAHGQVAYCRAVRDEIGGDPDSCGTT